MSVIKEVSLAPEGVADVLSALIDYKNGKTYVSVRVRYFDI